MSAPKIKSDPRLLAACAIDKDRCMKVRIALAKGKVLIVLRAFLELGSKLIRTASGIYFPASYLPKVIATLERADALIREWELEKDR